VVEGVMPEIETRENAGDREERERERERERDDRDMSGKLDGREEEEETFFCCYMHVTINIKILY